MKPKNTLIVVTLICSALTACKKNAVNNPDKPDNPKEHVTPKVSFKTNSINGSVFFGVNANVEDRDSVWVDKNNNKKHDAGETIFDFYDSDGTPWYKSYSSVAADTITIYGKLTGLIIGTQDVSQLDVTKATTLTSLYCDRLDLKALDLSTNPALKILSCKENHLNSLDLSKNTALVKLNCDNSGIKSLDLSKNAALVEINCSFNSIKSLDLSKNMALQRVWCLNNELEELDVTKCPALTDLYCQRNKLKHLELSANRALKTLACEYNFLSALNVLGNISLQKIWCNNNLIRANEAAALFNSLPPSGGGNMVFYNPDHKADGTPVDGNQFPYTDPIDNDAYAAIMKNVHSKKWTISDTYGR